MLLVGADLDPAGPDGDPRHQREVEAALDRRREPVIALVEAEALRLLHDREQIVVEALHQCRRRAAGIPGGSGTAQFDQRREHQAEEEEASGGGHRKPSKAVARALVITNRRWPHRRKMPRLLYFRA